MLIINLDGEQYNWKAKGRSANNIVRPCSNLHKKARILLQEIYPLELILEEVLIPITNSVNLYLDFYIPSLKLSIEVNGKQHYFYTPYFHKSKLNFLKAKVKDKQKVEFCKLNNITLIHLKYNEDINEWKRKISDN